MKDYYLGRIYFLFTLSSSYSDVLMFDFEILFSQTLRIFSVFCFPNAILPICLKFLNLIEDISIEITQCLLYGFHFRFNKVNDNKSTDIHRRKKKSNFPLIQTIAALFII